MRRWLLRVLGLLALGLSLGSIVLRMRNLPSTAAVDLLPLWLGGRAWLDGQDPNDPEVLQAIFFASELRLRVGGFFSYYPPTASVLAAPLATLEFKQAAAAWRGFELFALVVGTWLACGRRWAGAWIVAALLQLRVSWIVLPAAQPGPAVVLFSGMALAGLRSGRDGLLASGLAFGIATKLVPVAMVPALVAGRKLRALSWTAIGLACFVAAVFVRVPDWSLSGWLSELMRFVDAPSHPPWERQEPAWVMMLWRLRPGAVVGLVLVAAWVGFRRADALPVAALGVASVGLVMAGSHHYHEALVMLPAVAWLMGRSWGMALWSAILLVGFRTWDRATPPSALHWIPVGWGIWSAIVVESLKGTFRPHRA